MEALVLIAIMVVSLAMIPFGLPGTLVMVAAAIGYKLLLPEAVGWFMVVGVTVLMIIGEVLEWTLSAKYTRKYGGSRRAAWGAILGGMIGAFMGVPIPILGSVVGAFVGAFAGALVAELSRGTESRGAMRVATGALIGRAVAAAMKVAIGFVMAVWIVGAAII